MTILVKDSQISYFLIGCAVGRSIESISHMYPIFYVLDKKSCKLLRFFV